METLSVDEELGSTTHLGLTPTAAGSTLIRKASF